MDVKAFLIEDYKLKVSNASAHYTRMWTRFNFFLTIEAGLFGLLLHSRGYKPPPSSLYFSLVGAVVAFFWWWLASQDRFLVRLYRHQVEEASVRIGLAFQELSPDFNFHPNKDYPDAIRPTSKKVKEDDKRKGRKWNPLDWRSDVLFPTRFAALFPLLVLLFWLIMMSSNLFHQGFDAYNLPSYNGLTGLAFFGSVMLVCTSIWLISRGIVVSNRWKRTKGVKSAVDC